MRRKIFDTKDKYLIDEILNKASVGTLALFDGTPYAVPVNFGWYEDQIIFHGALKGRKATILNKDPIVGFTVVEEYSFIPSYAEPGNTSACPATQFFKSVMIEGKAERITERKEMEVAFEALMKKYQPEGRYTAWDDEMYDKSLSGVMLVKIIPDSLTAKFKFGQNEKAGIIEHTIKFLEDRGTDTDMQTIEWIKRFFKSKV